VAVAVVTMKRSLASTVTFAPFFVVAVVQTPSGGLVAADEEACKSWIEESNSGIGPVKLLQTFNKLKQQQNNFLQQEEARGKEWRHGALMMNECLHE
jgi:hypothetical protein